VPAEDRRADAEGLVQALLGAGLVHAPS
jgi:hypothetical protein